MDETEAPLSYACEQCPAVFPIDLDDPAPAMGAYLDHIEQCELIAQEVPD
jgi:hypothetical protein